MKLKPLVFLFVFLNVLALHVYLFYNYSVPHQTTEIKTPLKYVATLKIIHEESKKVEEKIIKKVKEQKKAPVAKVKETHKKIVKPEKKIVEKKKQLVVVKQNKPVIPNKKIEKKEVKTISKKVALKNSEVVRKIKQVEPYKSENTALDAKKQNESLKKYISYINSTIQKHKFYPKTAKNMGIEGKCTIMLCILNNGTIQDMKIVQNSNFTIFDKSALKIIEKIGSFKAFPYLLKKEIITLKIPINYKLKG